MLVFLHSVLFRPPVNLFLPFLPTLVCGCLFCFVYSAHYALQCVTGSARCDKIKQCIDGSDEDSCLWRDYQRHSQFPTPVIVEFSRTGKILVRSLSAAKGSVNLLCPETHFWCPDKDYCLPVFVRCNGVYDCLGHEDEKGCDVYTCPGFYRCRASKVCVHMSHVCDDWPLCPQHDDELLCDQTCPPQCTCHGLAFFCRQVFAAHLFPDLRYLDARGSGMSMHQFGDNPMLIHLSLATCGIRTVSNFTFNNLHSLDLSDNLLTEVSGHHFSRMSQLTVLFLAGNPLTSAFAIDTVSSTAPLKLNVLDLSRAKMHFVDSGLFLAFPTLQSLNLSHSGVELLQWNSSQMSETSLWDLDLRGCVITEFPRDVLSGFFHMQHLLTDDFKLCCPSVLTPGFDLNRCHVTPDDVSSCDDLLGSVMYRTAVAVLATLALLGNMVSLALRVCVRKTWRLSSGDMALTHLSVADLGLGLYLTTLGLADRLLAGQYVWQDNTWRRGAVCHLAGVLALSCRQATTFFTAILTLDRCSQRCQPLVPRLTSTKVKVICALNWASSLLLAALPVVLQWRFFGQQALCVPLPHTRDNSLASHYAFGVTVLVHIVMYGLCFVVEVLSDACNRITKPSIVNRRTCPKDFQFVILGSLTSGFLYTIACLVPVQYHTGSQKAAHTSLVYFGFVVSCAMNPYLHLCGVRVEHNKQIKEERLLKIVNRSRI